MRTIDIKLGNNEIQTVVLDKRIDENIFSCKSSSRKRNADLLIHIDYIISDVTNIEFNTPTYKETNKYDIIGRDEFEGLCQAHINGENPFKCTIMCSNPSLNEF